MTRKNDASTHQGKPTREQLTLFNRVLGDELRIVRTAREWTASSYANT